jgi:mRNA degradation ribonuclease J1/J2
MTGTAMTGLYRSDGSGAVLYTADVKLGPLTANTVETLAGKFDRIIMESTNFEGNKVSAGITEAKVRDSFIRIMREQANDTVVIVSAPNQLERLSSILEAAEATGRKVALGHSHALVVNQMRIGRQQAPLDVEGFNLTLPEIGEDVALWVKPQVNPQTYQKVLSEWAAAKSLGLVDQARLSAEGSKWVVVVTPYDIMRHQFGGVHFPGLSVIHSAPFPYARNAKVKLGDSQRWIRSQGGHYFTDFEIQGVGGRVIPSRNPYFLHVSGHATFEQMIDSVISPLLNGIYRNKQLILVHGENPVRYAEAMGRRLGNPAGLEIVSSLDRYRPSDPFKYSGYRLVLE